MSQEHLGGLGEGKVVWFFVVPPLRRGNYIRRHKPVLMGWFLAVEREESLSNS